MTILNQSQFVNLIKFNNWTTRFSLLDLSLPINELKWDGINYNNPEIITGDNNEIYFTQGILVNDKIYFGYSMSNPGHIRGYIILNVKGIKFKKRTLIKKII